MTQAILSQAGDAVYRAGSVVYDTTVAAVQWLGRAVVYLKDVAIEYAAKAIDFAGAFFCKASEYVGAFFNATKEYYAQNPQVFGVVGLAVGLTAVAFVIARVLKTAPAAPAPATV